MYNKINHFGLLIRKTINTIYYLFPLEIFFLSRICGGKRYINIDRDRERERGVLRGLGLIYILFEFQPKKMHVNIFGFKKKKRRKKDPDNFFRNSGGGKVRD